MKTKKLNLNKVTISRIDQSDMENVYGGIQVLPKTGGAFTCDCQYIPPTEVNKQ